MESWKDIYGYEGSYQVSNTGKVKSLFRRVPSFPGTNKIPSTRIVHEKVLKQSPISSKGKYFTVKLSGKKYLVHRLIAEAFIPNPENKPYINHKDSNRHNNSIDNLEWVTHYENIQHAWNNGAYDRRITRKAGFKSERRLLDDTQVRVIKNILNNKECSCIELSEYFKVKRHVIYNIMEDKTYTEIK